MNDSLQVNISDNTQDNIAASTSYVTNIIFYTCLAVGIIGNSVVILVYSQINKERRNDHRGNNYQAHVRTKQIRYYIPSLAAFDLAVLIIASSPASHINIWLCKVSTFLVFSAVRFSGLILLLTAIQRFMFIALIPKRVLSIRQLRISLAVVSVLGGMATLPDLFLIEITLTSINEIAVGSINETLMSLINETVVNPVNEIVVGSINETKCAFDQSFARKAAITASLVFMLLVIAIVGCLYAQILRILVTKLKTLNKEQGQRRKVSQLETPQETNMKYGSCKYKANTSNDIGAKLELTHGTRTHQKESKPLL